VLKARLSSYFSMMMEEVTSEMKGNNVVVV